MEVIIAHSFALPYFIKIQKKANEKKNVKAKFGLANLYAMSKNTEVQHKAFEIYEGLAKRGYTEAYFALGVCYELGLGIKQSYRKAIKYYRYAESSACDDLLRYPDPVGDAQAKAVRELFSNEEFVQAFEEETIFEYKEDTLEETIKKALDGDAKAQNALGFNYQQGNEVEEDINKAIFWYKESAKQNYEHGLCNLACAYKKTKKYKESAKWYRRYAEYEINWRNNRLGW